MTRSGMHPTQLRLIDTVSGMLDGEDPYGVLIERVLEESGVSRGSLYYHFGDFPALIEQTLLRRFSHGVDETIGMMEQIVQNATSEDDFWNRVHDLTVYSQSTELAPRRAERARVTGMAASNERFGKLLAQEQDRLTAAITDKFREAQLKGWVRKDVDPQALALFTQAYTMGRGLDDVAQETKVSLENWSELIRLMMMNLRG